jgi:hypothetical protein
MHLYIHQEDEILSAQTTHEDEVRKTIGCLWCIVRLDRKSHLIARIVLHYIFLVLYAGTVIVLPHPMTGLPRRWCREKHPRISHLESIFEFGHIRLRKSQICDVALYYLHFVLKKTVLRAASLANVSQFQVPKRSEGSTETHRPLFMILVLQCLHGVMAI